MNFAWTTSDRHEARSFRIISILFGGDQRLLEYFFDAKEPKIRRRAGILIDDAWNLSHGEQLLVKAALDIWSGSGHLQLWEIVETWDDPNWLNFLTAMAELKGLKASIQPGRATRFAEKPE
jgi:hypothetical protein